MYDNLEECLDVSDDPRGTTGRSIKINELTKVFPNPASDEISIVHSYEGAVHLKLINIQGLTEKTELIKNGASLSVDELPAGIYFLEISQNKVVLETLKLIIQ